MTCIHHFKMVLIVGSFLFTLAQLPTALAQESGTAGPGVCPKPPCQDSTASAHVEGKLLRIDGDHYIIKDQSGQQIRLRVDEDTFFADSPKKPGDHISAEVMEGGRAITIQ
ncbi:hypothetical protein [Candidatus Nitrospira salsa]